MHGLFFIFCCAVRRSPSPSNYIIALHTALLCTDFSRLLKGFCEYSTLRCFFAFCEELGLQMAPLTNYHRCNLFAASEAIK